MINKTCKQCNASFVVDDEDLEFYKKMSPSFEIPPPTLCADCRMRRRLTWRNERKLYSRNCDLCGNSIISIYSPDKHYKIYCPDCYYSDKWDPVDYGLEFDPNKNFFDQFRILLEQTPQLANNIQSGNENCDFTNLTTSNKNSYMIFAASFNEDSYYSTYIQRCKNIVDCFFTFDSELCYECVDCSGCYDLTHSQDCINCKNSSLLFGCQGCENCFGCTNLNHKQFYIFNQKSTKEDYEAIVSEFKSGRQKKELIEKFEELKKKTPRKYYQGSQNENFSGDHIINCKNTFASFDVTNLEDCKFDCWLHGSKNCYDCYAWGNTGELGYENHLCGNNFYDLMGCDSCWGISNLRYCRYCFSGTKNCFGCVGLKKGEYCVLNKQYSQAEYDKLVSQIIQKMTNDGEWGEFFPTSLSPFAYNETVANEYFPLDKAGVSDLGGKWLDIDYSAKYEGPVYSPKPIEAYKESEEERQKLLSGILKCEISGRPFKIIPQELVFYIKNNISVPTKHFDIRYKERFGLRNPRALYERGCMCEESDHGHIGRCDAKFKTSYNPDRPEKIYCENCYQRSLQ